ncbi:BACON domain-containing protein [uncultured Muribaculum sp.]|uniref:BACON domain-containing protein n=1 Tax=uncultured Muribaculum sp. TaxID=1918613 RepID=UPI00266F99BA|nr:BACON domain-containing protein [uncultured Muribaculum sp.]
MKIFISRFIAVALIALSVSCSDDNKPDYMDLSDKEMTVSADGGTLTMTVASNVRYVVNHQSEWINIAEATSSHDITTFKIHVSANENTDPRTGRIKFIGEGVTPRALDILQKGVVPTGVSVKEIVVDPGETTASFTVLGEGAWTATASNNDFVLSPDSGEGETKVTVTFPANKTALDKTTTITVAIDGKAYNVNIVQTGVKLDLITEWAIDENSDDYKQTWGATTFSKSTSGFIDAFALPTTGTGQIRFYNSDKSDRPDDGLGMRTQTGSHGDLMIRGCVTTDYWLIECGNDAFDEIPAGMPMRFEFTGHIYSSCAGYWLAEYMDGNEWKPLMTPKTTTLSSTEGLSGAPGNWSETFTYNYVYPKDGIYVLFEGIFTLQNPCEKVQIRLRPATEIAISGKYIDVISQSTCSRFTAQHPHEGDKAVKEYKQTVKLEFAN